ncbi:hypothetical protein IWZ01DRAFT_359286 [Phyllosticta capitalensis]
MPSTARRGPWSTAEDKYLLQIVQQQGANNWVRISQMLRTRTPKQCRERFHQNLKPTLNHNPITPEEGQLIERLVGEMGKKWAEIARRLHGRSDNAVKNWWNGGQNRRRRMSERRRSDQHHPSSAPSLSNHYGTPFQHPHHHINDHYHSYHQHRPSPISIHGHAYGSRAYDTPVPSPSGQSILSADGAPSLVTDSGSVESRSPIERSLPPLLGSRDERRRSSVAFLPRDSSFAITDDDQLPSFRRSDSADENRKRDILRLPEPHSSFSHSPPGTQAQPLFREPNYQQQMGHRSLPLLTQGFPATKPLPVEPPPTSSTSPGPFAPQQQLPSFQSLTQPGRLPSMSLTGQHSPPRGSTASSFLVEKSRSPGGSRPINVASILN